MQAPRLLPDLKNALQALQNSRHMDFAAHDHLLNEIQNRNTKRKIRSMGQQALALNGQQSPLANIAMGSSWLACMYILCQSAPTSGIDLAFANNPNERLFVAQIVLHRLRRVSISEAIDVEMEVHSTAVEAELQHNLQHLRELYKTHLGTCCPSIGSLLQGKTLIGDDEDTIKAELTIVALAAVACVEAAHPSPLYHTIVLALATAVFRYRYTTSLGQRPKPPSLIELLRTICLNVGLQNETVIWHTVSVLPDAILGSPGGARGRMSTDSQLILQAGRDMRSLDTHLLSHAPSHTLVETCTRWVAFLPLSRTILDRVLSLQQQELLADEFWLALFESASVSKQQIVCSLLGMAHSQPKTNRSKKRRQNIVEDTSTDEIWKLALSECQLRGDLASYAAPHYSSSDPHVISACANACLPHLLRHDTSQELFQQIATVFRQTICASDDRRVRALAFEPLYSLHAAALKCQDIDCSFLARHIASCALNLADRCGYPDGYFERPDAESDHDLEVERNDVRDLIRAVSCSGEGGSTAKGESSAFPTELSINVLSVLLSEIGMEGETSLHSFSALAKSINTLAGCCCRHKSHNKASREILAGSLEYMISVNKLLLNAFAAELSIQQLLPLSRITSILNSSFSPFLSSMAMMLEDVTHLDSLLKLIIETSLSSLERLPELLAPSILVHSSYDIRGTMRGPGGEDHVGCLAIMRLVSESATLTDRVTEAIEPYVQRMEALYFRLCDFDIERGMGNHHGIGVAPQTRRIMVGTLCKMERKLKPLVDRIAASTMKDIARCSESSATADLHRLVELTLDLAAFPPHHVAVFLSESGGEFARRCFQEMVRVCLTGYDVFTVSMTPVDEEAMHHWNRLRAALFLLVKKGAIQLSKTASSMLHACIEKECTISKAACIGYAESPYSTLFRGGMLTEEGVPAGVFIQNLLHLVSAQSSMNLELLHLLERCMNDISSLILLPTPKSEGFFDPRETTAESWFQVASAVAANHAQGAEAKEKLLTDVVTVVFHLLLMSSTAKTQEERSLSPVMSLDGPQTLAMISFLTAFLSQGGGVSSVLKAATLHMPVHSPKRVDSEQSPFVVLCSLLFRICSGALPPWAIEATPELYSLIFDATGRNADLFCFLLRSAMDITAAEQLGAVAPGRPISGPLFTTMPERIKDTFSTEVRTVFNRDDKHKWREIKAMVKRLCGGKKKETDYGQKPQYTKWEFDRV